ncbi:kinase-like domain-containing protein [Mycena sanguinolenta]|nr:kinase-like domain-containing protein [Mycena sanguinolenta]
MASPEHDLSTAAGVQAFLATTEFASSAVTLLTGGTGNFTFRLHLLSPYKSQTTLVLKHARPYAAGSPSIPLAIERQAFEAGAMQKIKEDLDCGPLAAVPVVYHFDGTAHVIIMEDTGEKSRNLKALMSSAPLPVPVAQEIGRALGQFLGKLHSWAAIDPKVVDFFDQNQQAKRITSWITYGRLIPCLVTDKLPAVALLPEPVCESDLDDIRAIIAERTSEIFNCRDTLTMGDFWTGNIMVNLDTDAATGTTSFGGVYIIDWELAKAGVAALDVGQFCAEMLSLILFKPHAVESAKALIEAFLTEYRAYCGEMKPHFANVAAKHIGAHLVTITPQVGWGTPEETVKAVEMGLEHLREGCSDRWVWEKSVLSPLME